MQRHPFYSEYQSERHIYSAESVIQQPRVTILCHFYLRPFWSYNSVFTEQESRECLKRKAASAHHQRSHAGLFIAFVSSVHSAMCLLMCVVFLMSSSGVWRDSGSPWHVSFPEIQKTCGSWTRISSRKRPSDSSGFHITKASWEEGWGANTIIIKAVSSWEIQQSLLLKLGQ